MAAGQGRLTTSTVSVTAGQTYTIKVGAGGSGGLNGSSGKSGGASSAFGITGAGGVSGTSYSDGNGGAAGYASTYKNTYGGTGSDGWVYITYKKERDKVVSEDYRLVRYKGDTYRIGCIDSSDYAQYMPLIKGAE